MGKICTECSDDGKWLPTSISELKSYLAKYFEAGKGVSNVTGIRKNIAYNLQYLQFQSQLLSEFNVTSVILTQTWKMYIIVGTGIIEAILYYLLLSQDLHKTTDWEEIGTTGNEVNLDGEKHRIENRILKKLTSPVPVEMRLDSMIKKVEKKKLLGANHKIYKKLQYLRKLRNKVHLHVIDEEHDTDWWKFNANEISTMKKVLYSFMTSSLFKPTAEEKEMFRFLK